MISYRCYIKCLLYVVFTKSQSQVGHVCFVGLDVTESKIWDDLKKNKIILQIVYGCHESENEWMVEWKFSNTTEYIVLFVGFLGSVKSMALEQGILAVRSRFKNKRKYLIATNRLTLELVDNFLSDCF